MIGEALQRQFSQPRDTKSFVGKLLADEDVERARLLVKKSYLSRSEVMELFSLLVGVEAKLLNYSSRDRFIINKFFIWIREYVKNAELLYDYQDTLLECRRCGRKRGVCDCGRYEPKVRLSRRGLLLLSSSLRSIEHTVKFLCELYLNIMRTSMSVGGTAFIELLKNKFEISYNNVPSVDTPVNEGRFRLYNKG